MVLVPESMLLELKGKLPKPPEFSAAIGLGQQLDQIESRTDLTPEEKAALYGQQLYRYRNYLAQARIQQNPLAAVAAATPAPTAATPADGAPAADGAAAPDDASPAVAVPKTREMDQQVIRSVSNKMQRKAGLLLDHLKKSNVIQWNDDGEISYRGEPIPGSNIVDLVTNTMKTKSSARLPPLPGSNEFAQALKETKVPRDYVVNPNVIKAMERPGKISTPRTLAPLKEYDEDEDDDDTGFHDASSITPSSTFMTPKRKKKSDILDYVFSPSEPSGIGRQRKALRWDVLRK